MFCTLHGDKCGLDGKQSACNAGDLDLNPGLWRSPGEGKAYPLQYSGLENAMDCIVHGILQARILEWVAFPFSRGSSQPRIEPRSPSLRADSFPAEPQGKPKNTGVGSLSLLQQIFPTQESNQGLLCCRRFSTNWAIAEVKTSEASLNHPFLLHGTAKPSFDLTRIISKTDTNSVALTSLNFQHTYHLECPVGLVSGALNSTSTIQQSVLHSAARTIQY